MKAFKLQYWAKDDKGGKVLKDLNITVEAYKHAAALGMTLRQYAQTLAHDCDRSMGEPLDQMYQMSGLFDGQKYGMPAMTLSDMIAQPLAADFRRGDGSDVGLGARLLYPQLILETMQANPLRNDGSDILSIWEELVSVSRNVNGTKVDQPIIDTTAPEGSRSGRIAQLAEPETMISITTGERSFRIPTNSIGLQISNEAMSATTIDIVRVVMEAQSRGDRIRRVNEQIKSMVFGDIDMGIAALPSIKANTFDSSIVANGKITKRAYIKWLHSVSDFANIGHILTNIDTAINLDESLLPTAGTTGADNSKIEKAFGGMDLGLTTPKLIPFKAETFGANTMVGLDARYAIQRFVNVSASYDAVEDYVMRKATGFRVDYGESATRLVDEAWSVLDLSV
jgi:hypothetical protein